MLLKSYDAETCDIKTCDIKTCDIKTCDIKTKNTLNAILFNKVTSLEIFLSNY